MNKKISVGIAASLVLIAITITFTATMIFSMRLFDSKVTTSSQRRDAMYEKMLEIDKVVRQYYYKEFDETALYDSLIAGYVNGLGDPNSVFLTAEEIATREQQAKGQIVSVGLDVIKDSSGYLRVTKVYADSSAETLGMMVDDIIRKIGDVDTFSLTQEEGQKLLMGVEATNIKVEYTREGEAKTAELLCSRIEETSVEGRQIESVYYIRIRALWNTAETQFNRLVKEAETAYTDGKIDGIVIDIRDLSGGHNLAVVAGMLDILLPAGTLLTGIYRGDDAKVLYTSDESNVNVPATVLVNGNTKGYAEAFAAVMQGSAICKGIVGATTAGKGTMQQLIKLSDGSGVDVSVALIKPPKGEVYNEIGVKPNSEVKVAEDFVVPAEPSTTTDLQFAKAVDILHSYT